MGRSTPGTSRALEQWAENQRSLSRALGLSVEDWLGAIDLAAGRATSLTAAVVGAAMARGRGLSVLEGLDGKKLGALARKLIDPAPPRARSPLLKEAIRRADDLGIEPGAGARRLRGGKARDQLPTPLREARPLGDSVGIPTPDAPGGRDPRRDERAGGDALEEQDPETEEAPHE